MLQLFTIKSYTINKDLDCPYPERSVMMYYSGDIKNKISEVNDEEIMESEIFSYEKAKELLVNRNSHIFKLLFDS